MEAIEQAGAIVQPYKKFFYFEGKFLGNFDIICDELARLFGCTYVSYALEMEAGKRIHYYSNRDWQEVFVKEGLITNCPLLKFARNTRATILSWNSLSGFLNKPQRYVMDARSSFNIGNGIGTKHVVYDMNEMSTFASTIDNDEFTKIFMQNIISFKKYVFQLRTLAIASMLASGWLHPSKINFNLNKITPHTLMNTSSLH